MAQVFLFLLLLLLFSYSYLNFFPLQAGEYMSTRVNQLVCSFLFSGWGISNKQDQNVRARVAYWKQVITDSGETIETV